MAVDQTENYSSNKQYAFHRMGYFQVFPPSRRRIFNQTNAGEKGTDKKILGIK
jgi:hypothetical protein